MARPPDVDSSEAARQGRTAAGGRGAPGSAASDPSNPDQVAPVRRRRSREREAAATAAASEAATPAPPARSRGASAEQAPQQRARKKAAGQQPAQKPTAQKSAGPRPTQKPAPQKPGQKPGQQQPGQGPAQKSAARKQTGAPSKGRQNGTPRSGGGAPSAARQQRPAPTSPTKGRSPEADDRVAAPAELPELVPEPVGRFNRLLVGPDTSGPRVRMGVLWFFLTLAAATGGRWWTAALWALAAAISAAHTVRAWQLEFLVDDADARVDGQSADGAEEHWTSSPSLRWFAAAAAAVVPLAAGYGTGLAGVALILVAAGCGLAQLLVRDRSRDTAVVSIAVLLSAMAAASVVIAVRIDLWAALFLILAVSLYDAGSYLMGAEAGVRWEGPVAGVIGVLAVTFTIATIDPPPFDRGGAWITGVVVALGCVAGQWVASANLPRTTASAPGLRRLDAYVLAGPAFVACAWLLGG